MIKKRLVMLAMAASLSFGALAAAPGFAQTSPVPQTTQTVTTAAAVYDAVSPSVVAIYVYSEGNSNTVFSPGMLPDAQTPPENFLQEGSGSGFVLSKDGYIVTNAHVVEGAIRIEVNFLDGTLVRGEVVGTDKDSDIAVIKVDVAADLLQPVTFADSAALDIGEDVFAIGSPFGQRWTLTTGIVSAVERSIPGLNQFSIGGAIQTDAAINPGNSGGPLLNARGEVIGMNSQIRTESGSSSGIGFAIPSNLVNVVTDELVADGVKEYAYLGIRGGDVSLALIEQLKLASNFSGVVVVEATEGGPAALAGLQNATDEVDIMDGLTVPTTVDIITAINGTPLDNIADLISYLATETNPGDTVTLDVLRNGTQTLQVSANLTARPTANS